MRGLALLLALAIAACRFSPDIASGSFACGRSDECPRGLVCSAAGRCCDPGSKQAGCSNAEAVPPDGASSGPDGAVTAPDPAPRLSPRLLVPGKVQLGPTFSGASPELCSRGPAAGGDRWCAVFRGPELWVVNVSQGLRSGVRCDGTDDACLRLSSTAFLPDRGALSYTRPAFSGNRLVFSADMRSTAMNIFQGKVLLWQPGWTTAREMTSDSGVRCSSAREGSEVLCVQRAASGQFDLLVGSSDSVPTLARVKTFADVYVGTRLTRDGSGLLFQEGPPFGTTSSPLWWAPTRTASDPATHLLLDANAISGGWEPTDDERAVYYLRPDAPPATAMTWRLSYRALVAASAPVDLADRIGYVQTLGHDTVAVLQDLNQGTGVLKLIEGHTAPRELTVGPTSVEFLVSADQRYLALRSSPDSATARLDLRIAARDTGDICTLQKLSQTEIFTDKPFSDNGELILWSDHSDPTILNGDGWLAHTRGCSDRRKFATRFFYGFTLADRGLLYLDEATEDGGVLRLVTWGEGMSWPTAGATVIDDAAHFAFTVIDPDRRLAVYVSRRPGAEGLYALELP